MMKLSLIYVFPGWIIRLLSSVRFLTAGSILLLALLLGVLLFFLFKRKIKPVKSVKPTTQEKRNINYDDILDTIKNQNGRLRTILFAANSLKNLPVTIPVNVAIRLSKNHNCLLIDLDTKRNSIARVFDLDFREPNVPSQITSFPTQFKRLYVWPARNFELLKQMNLRPLLESAVKKYDYILIYAPYLTTLPDRRQIATCTGQALTFPGDNSSRLMRLLEQCHCKVIREI